MTQALRTFLKRFVRRSGNVGTEHHGCSIRGGLRYDSLVWSDWVEHETLVEGGTMNATRSCWTTRSVAESVPTRSLGTRWPWEGWFFCCCFSSIQPDLLEEIVRLKPDLLEEIVRLKPNGTKLLRN